MTALMVVALLGALSLWSWRSLVAAGIGNHLPPFSSVGDVGQGVLFMRWLPFALGHGMNPFFSRTMFAHEGINMLSNTSFFLQAFLLAPVTIVFGPVASFDVAVLLAPVVSGAALYWVLRRYDIGVGPAMLAALLYAYSPYMAGEVPLGHFNLSWMFFPPLLLYLLDEISCAQAKGAVRSGLLLGVLVVVQFFSSPEILVDSALVAVVLLLVVAASHPRAIRSRLRHAVVAGSVALGLAGAVLGYPLWYLESGPGHVTTFNTSVSTLGIAVTSAVWPSAPPPVFYASARPLLDRIDAGFLGPVAVGLVLVSALLWRRYRLAPYILVGAVVSYVLALGPYVRVSSTGVTRLESVDHLVLSVSPLINVQPYRFSAFTALFVAIGTALCLDRTVRRLSTGAGSSSARHLRQGALSVAAGVAVLVVPMLGDNWHQPVERVVVPSAFTTGPLAHLRGQIVAVVAPPGTINRGQPLVWQAVAGMELEETSGYAWRQVTRSGTGLTEGEQGPITALVGPGLLGQISPAPSNLPTAEIRQVRSILVGWRVGVVLLVSGYRDTGRSDVRLFTSLVGRPPVHVGGSFVWTDVWQHLKSLRNGRGQTT